MDFAVRGRRGGGTARRLVARAKAQVRAARAQAKAPARGKKGATAVGGPLAAGGAARRDGCLAARGRRWQGRQGRQGHERCAAGQGAEAQGGGGGGRLQLRHVRGAAQGDLSASPLHTVVWSRIILDEAHRIKGRTNSTALAAYELKSSCAKWCLTGTPLQNRVGELYSLIRFLRMRPYAFYYCKKKGCDCECLTFSRDRYCPNCGHVCFMHYSAFKKE
ncbi:unnamed protein product, partial [Prorocentrum cordatum]